MRLSLSRPHKLVAMCAFTLLYFHAETPLHLIDVHDYLMCMIAQLGCVCVRI